MKCSQTKMTVLLPYKKRDSLISLLYAEETPRQWLGSLTRSKKSWLETWRQDLVNRHPCFLPPAAPKTKADIHPHQWLPPMLLTGASPAAQHCIWTPLLALAKPLPCLENDAPTPSMASVETPQNAPNSASPWGPMVGSAEARRARLAPVAVWKGSGGDPAVGRHPSVGEE